MNEEFNDNDSDVQNSGVQLVLSLALALLIAGCSGLTTTEEVAAQKQLTDVSAAYLPVMLTVCRS